MSTKKPDEEAIRALFEEAHADQPTPAFQKLWPQQADSAKTQRQRGLSLPFPLAARGLVAATLMGALVLILILATSWEGLVNGKAGSEGDPMIAEMAAMDSSWQGPLDFLLRTPGYELLETVPGVSTTLGSDLRIVSDSFDIYTEFLEEDLP